MAEPVTLVEREGFHALAISVEIGMMKIARVIPPAYEEIMKVMASRNAAPPEGGVPFVVYRDVDWRCFDTMGFLSMVKMMFFQKMKMAIAIPCGEPVPPSGRVEPMEVAPGRFVMALHRGPYKQVTKSYNRARDFATQEGLSLGNYAIERYLNDPHLVAEADLETEVLIPVA